MVSIIVNVAQNYWKKYYETEEGILEDWDNHNIDGDYVYFKLPKEPKQPFKYVIINLGGKLRGYFKKYDVKYLNEKYLKDVGLNEDFSAGYFVICESSTWKRLNPEQQKEIQRGFYYVNLIYR